MGPTFPISERQLGFQSRQQSCRSRCRCRTRCKHHSEQHLQECGHHRPLRARKIGVVGITTPRLGSLSSPGNVGIAPEDPDDIAALAAIVQEAVDDLTATGINKVIVAEHLQQIRMDEMMASRLRDVDIIISGGSNTLLADNTDRLRDGDVPGGPYPILTQFRSKSNRSQLSVQTVISGTSVG